MKTYTYDSANRLITVEDQTSTVNLSYNGLGQRLGIDSTGISTQYAMDGNQPLTASSSVGTSFYLYGLGPIAEEANTWAYSLPDGANTPRQLSDPGGEITLSTCYDPCPLQDALLG